MAWINANIVRITLNPQFQDRHPFRGFQPISLKIFCFSLYIFLYLWVMKAIKNIEYKINKLSPTQKDKLEQYLDYLLSKQNRDTTKKLRQDWAGELKGVNYNSVELQKKSLDWRRE